MTQKQLTQLQTLIDKVERIEKAFFEFKETSEKEHAKINSECLRLIQQQRDVIAKLQGELSREREKKKIRHKTAILQLRSE